MSVNVGDQIVHTLCVLRSISFLFQGRNRITPT